MATTTTTVSDVALDAPTLRLRSLNETEAKAAEEYPYAHLLPHFSTDRYPPLTPFDHVDPGLRALNLSNPRAFLDHASSVAELTPNIGTEVTGINLATLDASGRDQVALEVRILVMILTTLVITCFFYTGCKAGFNGVHRSTGLY
jgi:sulfonate dioxygenase